MQQTSETQSAQDPGSHQHLSALQDDLESGNEKQGNSIYGQSTAETEVAASSDEKPSEDDDTIVWWDGPGDQANPLNWPSWKKVVNGSLISALALITPLAASFFAPGVPELMQEFGSDNEVLAGFVVSVYILGFAFGPLVMAPLSEVYGRLVVYHACNIGFVVFVIACAVAPSLGSLIAFRFLSGIFGSCPMANANGSIVDMVSQEKRASAIGAITIGPLLGPIIGPVAGGFLAAAKGWRWVFWVLACLGGFLTVSMLLFLRETYAPVILKRKAARLRKETGNDKLRSKLDNGLTPSALFKRAIIRPTKLLVKSPIVLIFALYSAVFYGYLYLLFSSITQVFEETYHFSTSVVGLAFIGVGVGTLIALGLYAKLSDAAVRKAIAAQGGSGSAKPEVRLLLLPVGAILLPAGFFIYGWTAQYRVQWIVPEIGLAIIGFGNLTAFMAINMYLIDAYLVFAASALAAVTVIRSIGGALLPLVALRMYSALGLGWGNSLLGFIAVVLIPVPFIIIRFGEHIREKYKVKDL